MASRKLTRRAVLAFIALADAPTPTEVRFRTDGTGFTVDLDTVAAIATWGRLFGSSAEDVDRMHVSTFTRNDGRRVRISSLHPTWRGWKVFVSGTETDAADDTPTALPARTRAALADAATEPAPAA